MDYLSSEGHLNRQHTVINWLKKRTEDPRKALSTFTTGGFIFAGGFLTMLMSDQLITPSLVQEIIALIGLIAASAGALYALWGYLAISLFKIILYILDNDEPDNDRD